MFGLEIADTMPNWEIEIKNYRCFSYKYPSSYRELATSVTERLPGNDCLS